MFTFIVFLWSVSHKYFWATSLDLLIFLIPAIWIYVLAGKYLRNGSKHSLRSYSYILLEVLVFLWVIFYATMYSVGIGSVIADFTGEYIFENSVSFDFFYWAFAWVLIATALPLGFACCFYETCCNMVDKWKMSKVGITLFIIPLMLLGLTFPLLTTLSFYAGAKEYEKMSSGVDNIDDWFDLELYNFQNSWERPVYLKINKDLITQSFVDECNRHFKYAFQDLGYVTTTFSVENNAEVSNGIDGKNLIVEYNTKPNDEMSYEYLEYFNKASIREQIQSVEDCYSSEDPRSTYDIFMRQNFDKIIFKDYEGSVIETFDIAVLSE